MTHKMLVESDPYRARIAVLEDDRLTEIFVERHLQRGVVGNVYKGRVSRVLPGMQAAFVDIGLERDAFLYVSDVIDHLDVFEELEDGASEEVEAEPPVETQHSIDELLRAGQEIVVQVTKDPFGSKGARVSTQITLPGRYLVMLPTVKHLGVSRRIEDEIERARLRALLEELPPAGNGGWIVRTAGEDKGPEEFAADRTYLSGLWRRIRERAERAGAPTLLHQDLDLALRVVRDLVTPAFSVIWVDGEDTYERIVEFLDQVQPALTSRVKLDRQEVGLFERFGLEGEIENALKSKVWLKSGGYLVINPTEALVAIDVNSGRYVGKDNLEDTALRTNLEAVEEVVRQIRLRDLGGILVLDLIDMIEKEHREQVFAALERELRKDRAKFKVLAISEFGLVQITRKRSRANLERLLTQNCPYCNGSGRVKSIGTICLALRRNALRLRGTLTSRELLVRVHPEVARALQKEERAIVEELERVLGVAILLQGDAKLHHENFDLLEV